MKTYSEVIPIRIILEVLSHLQPVEAQIRIDTRGTEHSIVQLIKNKK